MYFQIFWKIHRPIGSRPCWAMSINSLNSLAHFDVRIAVSVYSKLQPCRVIHVIVSLYTSRGRDNSRGANPDRHTVQDHSRVLETLPRPAYYVE